MMPESIDPYFSYEAVYSADGNYSHEWDGYLPSVVDMLSQEMGFSYEFVSDWYDPIASFWTPLVSGAADVVMVALSERIAHLSIVGDSVAISQPFFSSDNTALVLKTKKDMGLWRLFEPFTPSLWIAVACNVFLVGMTINLLEGLSSGRLKGAITPDAVAQSHYHAWIALLGGEDYEWVSWPGRCLRLGLLFLVLIVISTYTANLAAFFTTPVYDVHGPTDLESLKSAVACTIWPNDYHAFKDFASDVIYPDYNLPNNEKKQWCHDALKDGRAQVWFDDNAAQNAYLLKHCSDLSLVPAISLKPMNVGFAMNVTSRALVSKMSAALVHLEQQPPIKNLQQDLFGWGRVCPTAVETDTSTVPVSFESLGGAFLISGSLGLLAILVSLASCARKTYTGEKVQENRTATEGEMLRSLLRKVGDLERSRGRPSWAEDGVGVDLLRETADLDRGHGGKEGAAKGISVVGVMADSGD
ncbi:unnamed protein product [Prorocentrum cordatum]|uniref:Ionotropic glutamate receptor C-terminal domain-containing protein n=1 Tax=Prorocentrum cordatum TaxID=2364126 RepID=A0ABN9XXR6_9DINO|nr:unnamed protein product [Polarella glacialis]